MSPKIHQSFWSDPDIEPLSSENKLALLWIITNSQTNLIGVCKASPRRFSFETGLEENALKRALEALTKPLLVIGENVFIRNFIRHQFGTGEKLTKNNIFQSMLGVLCAVKDSKLRAAIISEYPEFKGLCKPLPRAIQGEREGEGERTEKDSQAIKLIHHLNLKSGKGFRETVQNIEFINSRLSESGVDFEGCKKMIDRQCSQWMGNDMEKYIRPETLFNATKFDGYYAAKDLPIQNYATNSTSSPKRIDRNQGTANDGKASQYRGVGKVGEVPNTERTTA